MNQSLSPVLTLREHAGRPHAGYPMVTGVPLKQGVVRDAEALVLLDEQGKALPGDAAVTARWADGSIKWALMTVPRLTVPADARQRLSLGLRQGGTSRKNPSAVKVTKVAAGLRVHTGRLRFTINTHGVLVRSFESYINGKWRKRAGSLDDTVTMRHGGDLKTYQASRAERTVEIEQASRQRVVVTVRGTHTSGDGSTYGPYVLRFECLADSPQLRLTHSMIFDGDPQVDQLAASEITLEAVVGKEQQFGFGADEGLEARFPRQQAHFTADYRYAELYQDSVSHWRLERWVDPANRSVFCDEGLHCDGWMELAGSEGRMAVAVREGWQNHPKSWFVDAETGLMRVGLYARRAEPVNFRRYSEVVYSHTYECPSFKHFKEGVKPPYIPRPRDPIYNAHGIRKTHNLVLMFDEPNPSLATYFYNKPLRLTWPASYNQRTGIVVPAGAKLTRQARKETLGFLDLLGKEMLRSGGTGYIDYFDLPHGFDPETQRWFHDYGGFGYLNNEGMPTLGLWQAYLLTGRRDALELGAAMARHNNDIDSFHLGHAAGTGARHNVTHWADQDREPRVSQPLGTRFYYYMTGDRSYLDLVPVILNMWQTQFAEPKTVESHANLPSLIITLLTAQEAGFGDYDAWLRQCADALAAGIDERGVLAGRFWIDATKQRIEPQAEANPVSYLMFPMFGGTHTYAELAERYDHQPLRDALVRFARYQAQPRRKRFAVETGTDWKNEGGWKEAISIADDSVQAFNSLDLYGYAFQQTGDEAFRRAIGLLQNTLPITLQMHGETRYGQADATTRTIFMGQLLPRMSKKRLEVHRLLFPLFNSDERMQHLRLALWLQKLQGAAILGALDEPATSSKRR